MNKGPFPNSAIRPVFREIISASLSLEHELRVVYLGPEATFSHLAAIKQFGQSGTFIQSRSLRDIFTMVEHGEYDYGVVPIENTTEGGVNPTLDMFIDTPLKISAEILLLVIWTERYLETPETNPEGYAASGTLDAAGNLRDALLLVHGTGDDNVHPQNTLALLERLVDQRLPVEAAIYPRQKHTFKSVAWKHALARATAFLDAHLKPAGGATSGG